MGYGPYAMKSPIQKFGKTVEREREETVKKQKWRAKEQSVFKLKTLSFPPPTLSLFSLEMDSKVEEPVRTKMESLRLACDRQIMAHQQKMDAWTAAFRESLLSIRARAQETVQCQG